MSRAAPSTTHLLTLGVPPPAIASPLSERPTGSRIRGLLLALTALGVLFLWTVTWDPVVEGQLRSALRGFRRDQAPNYAELFRRDPPVGSLLSPAARARVEGPKRPVPALLVYVGDCAGCLGVNLTAWERAARKRGIRMVLLTSAEPEAAAGFVKRLELRTAAVVRDPDGALGRVLNACFLSRAYLVTPEGRLRWIQKQPPGAGYSPFTDPEFPRDVHST